MKLKIGDNIDLHDASSFYHADGIIIGETKKFWRVKIFNHSTLGELWKEQLEEIKLFHKDNLMNRGFSKDINTGCITSMSKKRGMNK